MELVSVGQIAGLWLEIFSNDYCAIWGLDMTQIRLWQVPENQNISEFYWDFFIVRLWHGSFLCPYVYLLEHSSTKCISKQNNYGRQINVEMMHMFSKMSIYLYFIVL